ncbi:hypothetical protein ACSBR1_022403 [Camellia fascicularis]
MGYNWLISCNKYSVEKHTIKSWKFNSTLQIPAKKTNKKALVVGLTIGSIILVGGLELLGFVLWKKRIAQEEDEEFTIDMSMDNKFETEDIKGIKIGKKGVPSRSEIISHLRQRNLVQLVGWCHNKRELLLVYEFMENGSLDYHLFKEKSLLTWARRYKIAQGLASALFYLHEEWKQYVVYRDVKSSNVMLDSNFNAKLGDFGLARLVDHGKDFQTTILAGIKGYMAPECLIIGNANKESDAIDPKIWPYVVQEEMVCLMIVGLWCAHPDHNLRPSIKQAIHVLNFEAPLQILPTKMLVATYITPSVNPSSLVSCTNSSITFSNSGRFWSSSYNSYHTNFFKFASFSIAASGIFLLFSHSFLPYLSTLTVSIQITMKYINYEGTIQLTLN